MTAAAVHAEQLEVRYGPRAALSPTTVSITRGAWVALLGPNGSGKSTLLRSVATLVRPSAGRLTLFGTDPFASRSALRAARGRTGVVFQNGALDGLLTVRENLRLVAACFGLRDAPARIERMSVTLGIADRLDDRVGTLSGGLMRRADLARALLPEPDLLLLDEPTTGLDFEARRRFVATITELRQRRPLTVVCATHQIDEAEAADRVLMMARGAIVADDAPAALRAESGGLRLTLEGEAPSALGVRLGEAQPDGSYRLDHERASLAGELAAMGASFRVGPATLADAYLERTGERLEDGA